MTSKSWFDSKSYCKTHFINFLKIIVFVNRIMSRLTLIWLCFPPTYVTMYSLNNVVVVSKISDIWDNTQFIPEHTFVYNKKNIYIWMANRLIRNAIYLYSFLFLSRKFHLIHFYFIFFVLYTACGFLFLFIFCWYVFTFHLYDNVYFSLSDDNSFIYLFI